MHHFFRSTRALPALALLLSLTACGGGGAGGIGGPTGNATPAATTQAAADSGAAAESGTGGQVSIELKAADRVIADTRYVYDVNASGASTEWRWSWGDGSADARARSATKAWHRPGVFTATVSGFVDGKAVSDQRTVTAIGAAIGVGGSHTCALTGDGGVACWGNNANGQLGDGTRTNRLTPVKVTGLSDAVSISVAGGNTCALRAVGTVVCWGQNDYGQLGDGSQVDQLTPVAATGLDDVVALSANETQRCLLRKDSRVWCWGAGRVVTVDQFGNVTLVPASPPAPVPALEGAVTLADGSVHACTLKAEGVFCAGSNPQGQLGTLSPSVQASAGLLVGGVPDAIAVAAGGNYSCALSTEGVVRCWGSFSQTTSSDGSGNIIPTGTPVTAIPGLADAVAVRIGFDHACAVRADRTVACWGTNTYGQLGDGTTTDRAVPVTVPGLTDVVALGLGPYASCALRSDASMACWGRNMSGRLATGDTTDRANAAKVVGDGMFWR